ncbi:MAG: cytochrome c biogenesis protein CcsA [Alphaproteobacteria bacterium]|nr:cytochrome c biogenesis protein CcsA [Alphaproteobacteria bacterium]
MIRFLLIFIVAINALALPAKASEWRTLPIVHEGRVKPIDSFARVTLKTFSGSETLKTLNASEWLKTAIFTPANAMDIAVFKTQSPDVLNLPIRKSKLYSYQEIANGIQEKRETIQQLLNKDESSWTGKQHELIRLYQNFILHTQLLRSLTAILPLPFDIPEKIKRNDNVETYLDLKKIEKRLTKETKSIISLKGANPDKYNNEELQIADLSFQLRIIEEGGTKNTLLKIIPDGSDLENVAWHTPWEILLDGHSSPQKADYLKLWEEMARAYINNDTSAFDDIAKNAQNQWVKNYKLKTEVFFNSIPLKTIALSLYLISVLLSFLAISKPQWLPHNVINMTFITALALHVALIVFRVFILERPPVGTLYESVLFVSLVCALITGVSALKHEKERRITTISIGSLSAFILLYVSGGLAGNDTMSPLVAVLNTNFWLTTHVLCITAGYGFCLIAGVLAHVNLWQEQKTDTPVAPLITMSVLALLFTAVGTALGGIWADQSWGRFWGWDPKENGALLIVLWLIWLLHGRISGHLRKTGFMIGLAFINIIVVLAWFGVNLLNIGLHSYGFIDGIAMSITAFILIETSIIGYLVYRLKKVRHEN